ncbi:phosphotransferase [Jannaschia aquimarina]|uniref:Phosphotransferase enzyme family protein n=1 Tax=Jannaschia aquimarina TaxID=935700 RepID=A0A0D1ECJ2_9RHOB|nr:phosphotransferase [Jannaschia aquimarina]KIT15439.1 Phosphotransferase enzyme family protein [Jannaschia aquimarina]SNT22347.1 Phosphotransferase enzyme family protein [Jannaschia aquimarina]
MPTAPIETDLELSARASWPRLRQAADLPDGGWSIVRLSLRDDLGIARVTCLATHADGTRVVIKHQLRPYEPDAFVRHAEQLRLAHAGFPADAAFAIPGLLAVDRGSQSMLMEYVPGRALADLMREAADVAEERAFLTRAGAWLDRFHRSGPVDRAPFDTLPVTRQMRRLRRSIRGGERSAPAQFFIVRGTRHVEAMASCLSGGSTVNARRHGDLHMRNLILSDTCVSGVDISADQPGPVGHDIAKLLLDYVSLFRMPEDLPHGRLIPDDVRDAFFGGYGVIPSEDRSIEVLAQARLIQTMMRVPSRWGARTDAKRRSYERLRPLLRHVFSSDPEP